EVRLHRVPPGSRVRQTGWALPDIAAADGSVVSGPRADGSVVSGPRADGSVVSGPRVDGPVVSGLPAEVRGCSVVLVSRDGLRSLLAGLHGYTTATALTAVGGTAFGSPALVPALDGVTPDGWAVALAVLDGTADAAGDVPVVRIEGEHVTLTWPDGSHLTVTPDGPLT
ncbi:MAG: hypothetical protein HOW59_06415, partial [Nonomuraea sp.]|nr:hypothetical protein [Nonomuraea sp.]